MSENKVVMACVDGATLSEAVCDYGARIAKTLNIPLKLLNTIEHDSKRATTDLSGNIGLGTSEELLDEIAKEEAQRSKEDIKKGKALLQKLRERAKKRGAPEVIISQRHGTLSENLKDLEGIIRILIIGIRGSEHPGSDSFGSQIEEILRSLHTPTFLINREFREPKNIMIAYDGRENAKKALDMVAKTPVFEQVTRHLVHAAKDTQKAKALLEEASSELERAGMEIETEALSGDPLKELVAYQERKDIDITAMGAFSHNLLKSRIFGSFTAKMLSATKSPLLLLR